MQTLLQTEPARHPHLRRTASYLVATETHTFASSVAAHALLSFFPFIVCLLSLALNVLHSVRLYHSLLQLVGAYLPVGNYGTEHTRSFILNNLRAIVERQSTAAWATLLILLFTSTGVFLPLEVALNRIWNARDNRSYLHNWAVAEGLAFTCGVLGVISASFTAVSETYSSRLGRYLNLLPGLYNQPLPRHLVSIVIVRAVAVPFTITMFFLIYWWLPNARVPVRRVLPAAILAGLLWEVSKYLYILLLPWLNFPNVYGPFAISVSLVMWAYVSALILLTCAQLTAPAAAAGSIVPDLAQVPAEAPPRGAAAVAGIGAQKPPDSAPS